MDSNPDINEFIKLITCPLTGKIFKNPIIANSVVYEKAAYIENNKEENNKKGFEVYIEVVSLKSFIHTFLESYPEYESMQYRSDNSYLYEKRKIDSYILSGNFEKILEYKCFSIKTMGLTTLSKFLIGSSNQIFEYFIKNAIDINEEFTDSPPYIGWNILNYMCTITRNIDINKIKLLLEHNPTFISHKCRHDNFYPLYQLCLHDCMDNEFMVYMINKHVEGNVSLYEKNCNNEVIALSIIKKYPKIVIDCIIEKLGNENSNQITNIIHNLDKNSNISALEKEGILNAILQKN